MKKAPSYRGPEPMNSPHPMDRNTTTAACEQAKFQRLKRILRSWGHELRQCPPGSPEFAERGRYYVVCDDGAIASDINLVDALLQIGKPSTPRWHVTLMLAMYSPEMRGVIRPVKEKPGFWEMVEDAPEPQTEGGNHAPARPTAATNEHEPTRAELRERSESEGEP
jgi:hypothetical protein